MTNNPGGAPIDVIGNSAKSPTSNQSFANDLGATLGIPNLSAALSGTGPMLYRIGLGAGGVAIMIVGLLIMGASSKTGGQVLNGAVAGAGIASPAGIGKAIGKAAVAA